jgi:CelD/BcsL family acetyltransferase involved in cellulose biosynthesis
MIKVTLLPIDAIDGMRDVWDSLRHRQALVPILDVAFFVALLNEFGDGKEVLAICSDEGRPVAATILHRKGRFVWETFQSDQAPVAAWVDDGTFSLEQISAALAKALPGPCFQLGITRQDPLIRSRVADSSVMRSLEYVTIARLSISGSFDAYWASRGKNLRQNLKKQRNKLERDSTPIRFLCWDDVGDMARAVTRYADLESSGWKSQGGTALARGGAQARFYTDLLEQFAASRSARVFELYFGDKLVASDLCLFRDRVLIMLKTTHDEHLPQMSPAMLLKQEIIRHGCEAGEFDTVEFYGKAMDWHLRLTEDLRDMYHVNIYRNSIAAKAFELRRARIARAVSDPANASKEDAGDMATDAGLTS